VRKTQLQSSLSCIRYGCSDARWACCGRFIVASPRDVRAHVSGAHSPLIAHVLHTVPDRQLVQDNDCVCAALRGARSIRLLKTSLKSGLPCHRVGAVHGCSISACVRHERKGYPGVYPPLTAHLVRRVLDRQLPQFDQDVDCACAALRTSQTLSNSKTKRTRFWFELIAHSTRPTHRA